ncbi:MAG: AGE family epimerase/isomerase [Brevinematia bacterium]
MRKKNFCLIFIFLILSCNSGKVAVKNEASLSVYLNPEFWRNQAINEIIPFWENSIDLKNGGFFTDVDYKGKPGVLSTKYTRMISRIVYAYSAAYLLTGDEKYLNMAKHGIVFQTNYGWDKEYGGWNLSTGMNNIPFRGTKNLFDETYGNLGPVIYYFTTHDKNVLKFVTETHRLMKEKAYDKAYGGFYAEAGHDWSAVKKEKSFNSQIDTCSAYLFYYYMATKEEHLLDDIKIILDVVIDKMINKNSFFVGEYFTRDWHSLDSNLWTGHNLKTGWILMRAYWLTGNENYKEMAKKIAENMLLYCWDEKYYGWYFQFVDSSPKSVNTTKDWWTQTEGNFLMLNLYKLEKNDFYLSNFVKCSYFWNNYLMDKEFGECYANTSRDGSVNRFQPKGYMYKSGYHSMEHALFNYLYLSLYVLKKEASLYFCLSADGENEKHYVVLPESPDVHIKAVEINGKQWGNFNPEEGYIILPKGKDMKVKVIYSAKAG